MSLLGLQYFLTLAEELNFSKAAEKLYIRQQTLSIHIKRLEKQYGVTLFKRRPYLHLTPAGETMVFYAKQLLDTERNMATHLADIDKAYIGHLYLGMSRHRLNAIFCDIWKQYHNLYPNISISLEEKNTKDLLVLLRNHAIDICVGVNVPPAKDLIIEPILRESYFCCLTDSLLRRFRPQTWQEDKVKYEKDGIDLSLLTDFPFFIQSDQNRIGSTLKRLFASNETPPNIQLETNNQNLMLRLADDGVVKAGFNLTHLAG